MLVAPIDGVGYNSQSCQILFSKYLKIKSGWFVTIKIKLDRNKYKFGLNDYKLNSNWIKNVSFGSSIWAGSSIKLMLTTEIPGKSTHYNQVFAMQRFLISLRKEAMKKKTRLCCICSTISFSEKIIDVSVLVCQLF